MPKVLYVEDDPEHCLLLTNMLTARGFTVETAPDGFQDVAMAREWQPDLILLDLLLPRMDGFGVMKSLKENAATQDIPVIVISAWPTADNRRRVQEAGARGFISKPFKLTEVVSLIQENLSGPGAGSPQPDEADHS